LIGKLDRVGGLVFNDNSVAEIKPLAGSKGVIRVINQIVKTHQSVRQSQLKQQSKNGSMHDVLARLRRCAHTGSSVCLVSDFAGFDSGANTKALLQRNHVAAVKLFDPMESQLPPPGSYAITDGLSRGLLKTASAQVRSQYRAEFNRKTEELNNLFRGDRFFRVLVSDDPVQTAALVMGALPGGV